MKVPWSEPGSRYTALFEWLVIRWLQEATVSAVARQMHLDWDAVHGIRRQAVERGLSRREALAPRHIAIDETSEKKGHNYLTIVSEGPRVLYVAKDREKASIDGFWETLSQESAHGIQRVSVDCWKKLLGWMKRCRLRPMLDLAKSIENHLWMILNAIRLHTSSGCAE